MREIEFDFWNNQRDVSALWHDQGNEPARHRVFSARAVAPKPSQIAHMLGFDDHHATKFLSNQRLLNFGGSLSIERRSFFAHDVGVP